MVKDTYLTISEDSEGLYKEKGSKFLSFAYAVKSELEVKEKINILKKKYYDATHHCFAYILGVNQEIYRANDDGEPAHSAGIPIWGQIRSHQLTDVLVVVVRYYGGVNLGVGGLVNAYKTAANLSLESATKIEKLVKKKIIITFEYPQMNEVMKLVKDLSIEISTQKLELNCTMELYLRLNAISVFKDAIALKPIIITEE
ncbi:MAG: YigZ family protein [Bacteroidetes bacterium]|nr:MAG: YigZ family protein [Bacteroidota bacterium]TAG89132.1 MAG: YigZ family protein [Bacteroidota bacterium]